jgi:hypothetical protein
MKKLLLLLALTAFSQINAQTWTEQFTGTVSGSFIGDISIVDSNIAWAMVQRTTTNHQAFSKTIDGGTTWTPGTIGVGSTTNLGIANISAVSGTTAYIAAFPITAGGGNTQGVYRTINGGTTWTKQTTAAFNSSSFIDFVYFWDANNGVCVGDKAGGYFEIYTTTNGGTNWVRTPSANIESSSTDFGYTGKYTVRGNTIWFGTDGGELMRSTDKGLNWTTIVTPISDFGGGTDTTSVAEFAFADDNNGVIVKENFDGATTPTYLGLNFYLTTDGGANWTDVAVGPGIFHGGGVAYAGPSRIITAGSSTGNFGTSYSVNNGTTWTAIDAFSHTCLTFKDATTGWGGGFATATTGGAYKYSPPLSNSDFGSVKSFLAYPNPASGLVTIESDEIDSYDLSIVDLTGKTMITKSMSNIENSVDISALSNGVYFFNLTSDNKKETVKIIKN